MSDHGDAWQRLLPARLGDLPLGGDLVRTEPGGDPGARIAVLGVYPAVTKLRRFAGASGPMNVPVEVEATSFDPASRSGRELDEAYLSPLGLERRHVFVFDVMPYYLANTTPTGTRRRSMWDVVQLYQRDSGHETAVRPRPEPESLIALGRTLPGNLERLASYLRASRAQLLITLGNEAAAFVRGDASAEVAQPHLHREPVVRDVLGRSIRVLHLPHPGAVMRSSAWRWRHSMWCRDRGRALVRELLR